MKIITLFFSLFCVEFVMVNALEMVREREREREDIYYYY